MTAAAPTIRERLGAFIAFGRKRGATEAIGFESTAGANFGPGIGNQPSHDTLLRESRGIAATATRAIANRVSTLNPLVKTKRRVRDGTVVEETLDDHRLKLTLDRPHPNFTLAQLLGLATNHIVTVGEAYWLKVGDGFGLPSEFHPMPPGKVMPLVFQGVIEAYRVRDGAGNESELAADTICRFVLPDPENIFGSEGYLAPEAVTADSLKFSGEHLRRHYQHDATPKSVLETSAEATAFTKPERDRFAHEWVKQYHARLGQADSGPAVLPIGYKMIKMAMESGVDVVPLLEFWRDEQLMGYGTPRSVLGQVVSGDRSSAETNQYVFDRHAVLPIATMIAEAITLQIAKDFDESIFVEFEGFVSADKQFELTQETADLIGKVRSVNQVREDRGLDDVSWGDDPVATIGQLPYDPEGFAALAADVPGSLGDDEPDDETDDDEPRVLPAVARKRMRAYFSPDNEWQRQIRREKKFVPAMLKAVRSIFRDQQASVLSKLSAQDDEPRARIISADPDALIDSEEWERLFRIRVEPIRQGSFREIMLETMTGLGAEDAFLFTDAMREMLEDQGAQLVKNANNTTKRHIAAELKIGTGAGEGVDQIAKRIEGVFRVRSKVHARTIARTEILKASQTAQLAGFESSGVVERKAWNTNRDPEVRDAHAFAEGQSRELDGFFDLGGELADAPGIGAGGSALSAGNSINCRCFLTPVLE